jgi:hypothetical protein
VSARSAVRSALMVLVSAITAGSFVLVTTSCQIYARFR